MPVINERVIEKIPASWGGEQQINSCNAPVCSTLWLAACHWPHSGLRVVENGGFGHGRAGKERATG